MLPQQDHTHTLAKSSNVIYSFVNLHAHRGGRGTRSFTHSLHLKGVLRAYVCFLFTFSVREIFSKCNLIISRAEEIDQTIIVGVCLSGCVPQIRLKSHWSVMNALLLAFCLLGGQKHFKKIIPLEIV